MPSRKAGKAALIILLLSVLPLAGDPVINEFLASNTTVNPDNSDFDDYSDWLELHNPGDEDFPLANYFLTDNLDQPFKWQIPSEAVIPAHGYLLFRADGYDARPGETHVRGYYPWGSTFTTRRYHTNFKLSAEGESIGLYRNATPIEETTLIEFEAIWKYQDDGADPGPDWMMTDYNDGGWPQGIAQLGYGEGDENTLISYGPNENDKYPTTHFRHHFTIPDPSVIDDLRLDVLVDDGAVFYLNGVEFSRIRMGSGDIDYQDHSAASVPSRMENIIETVYIPANLLRAGDNVLAAEVHQHSATSSDVSFNASLRGTKSVIETFVPLGAVWKYFDRGTYPGSDWMKTDYPDSDWPQGPAQLGYGDGDENTVVDYGPDSNDKYPTTYFRHQFSIPDASTLSDIQFRVLVDDGAIVYLNGKEVTRLRMSAGAVGYRDYAGELGEEGEYDSIDLPAGMLEAGNNILAVEVHQYTKSSSDISFDAELVAKVVTGTPVLVDSVSFGPQTRDVSYGRDPHNPEGWLYFGEPTPRELNSTDPLLAIVYAPALTASLDSGFFSGAQTVELGSDNPVSAIRYTLDGSVPGSGSLLYTHPFPITETTIVRARAFVEGAIPGPILTRSFLIDEPEGTLPVVSMVADPDTFFDDSIGIYENDTEYPFKGREVPVRVEFFEPDHQLGFAVSGGVRIGGENIWRSAQKPLNLTMRGKYGDDAINYQVFPGEPVGLFDKLKFRNGGDNWSNAMLRDAMIPSLLRGQAENELSSYRPCILFLNGQFWGIYNIRKRLDESFFANEHYLAEGSYDVVQYSHDEFGDVALLAEIGTTESYQAFMDYFNGTDFSDPANYEQMESRMNVDSFIDQIVAIDYCANTSWKHNREFWSAREEGSRWQWNITDLDRGFNEAKINYTLIDDFKSQYPLFKALEDNPDFVNRLLQRYAAHVGSTYHPDRVVAILDQLSSEVDSAIERHISRWKDDGGIQSLETRQDQLDEIKRFVTNRPSIALGKLESELGLSRGMADLTIKRSPEAGGSIRISGVPMAHDYSDTIQLFMDTPVELTAVAAPGYSFTGWSNGNTESTIEISLSGAQSITANFQSGSEFRLPSSISTSMVLSQGGSPYTIVGDLTVEEGSTLNIDSGVQLLIPKMSSIYVYGTLLVNGTKAEPVVFEARAKGGWGSLNFVEADGQSQLSHLVIRDASRSRHDPVNLKAAVSAYNSNIILDHVDIEAPVPVFCQYGSTTMSDSTIKPLFTGDGINIKSGSGVVQDSTFVGNEFPDTDAIDFDNVTNGIISGNRIYAFRGFNSDAIDVGEGSQNLLVADNRIFNITDKGVSVGQASTVWIEGNLIVDCTMGVGVKDMGSMAHIDQNTFVSVDTGVASYEKNPGNGGGNAFISNCIFSRSRKEPVYVDSLSSLTVRYSLSDTIPLDGTGNMLDDPLFKDAGSYDFSLTGNSPAIDTGDPDHPRDSDGSLADMGAYYNYNESDYPFLVPNVIVVNEVLAHSHDAAPDWIELYNNSSNEMNIGGWFLSDDTEIPEKYRIPTGTLIPAHGYLVFYEDLNFGHVSTDPGALVPFALSENGDSVSIYGPGDGLRPDYFEKESFGASMTGISLGRIYKTSTRTFNFVAMQNPTPGMENSDPLSGPIVISEIMYHPANPDSEYLELVNTSDEAVALFDEETGVPWKMTDGINFQFPSTEPVVMQPAERIILTRDTSVFSQTFSPPEGTRVFQWSSGGLNNGGERLQLSRPGDVDEQGERQYIRVDRVNYSDEAPWPVSPDGGGEALVKIDERAYGNDPANWTAADPTAGETAFHAWSRVMGIPAGESGPDDNPDGDRYSNLEEYAFGTNPAEPERTGPSFSPLLNRDSVSFALPAKRPDLQYRLQSSESLGTGGWTDLDSSSELLPDSSLLIHAARQDEPRQRFYRLLVRLLNQDR